VGLKSGSGAQIGVTTTLASYEFDDENQLVSVTQGSDRRTTFVYDGKRRRRVTREEIKGSSGWVLASETRYVYDGMRVIQERNINGVPMVAYTRGPDLSGTLEGAGGIGGLLARSEWDGSAWSRHAFYHSDGVGNVTALAVPNGNDIALVGSYRYDPFGRLIGTPTGLAAINTQRYSSKDWHNPSGFYYFGYRFYDPATQRWLNRDPIAEEGGVNLYGYVENDPINFIDPLGLSSIQAQVLVAIAKGDLVALESLLATGMLSPAAAARVQEAINRLNSPAVQSGLDKACKVARTAAKAIDHITVHFGKNSNQIQHAFRHTDALGLDRAAVQSGVQNHFNTVASQFTTGRPFIQVTEVAGQRIQYTAFKLQDGTVNVGRIHAAP
jgi:RHS repeat-associated protein